MQYEDDSPLLSQPEHITLLPTSVGTHYSPHLFPANYQSANINPTVAYLQKSKKRKFKALIALPVIAGSIALMLAVGLMHNFQNQPPLPAASQPTDAEIQELTASDRYREFFYRHERTPGAFTETPGAIQQLIANEATNKAEAIERQRTLENHPGFRKHSSVLWALAETNGNEKVLLATIGQGAILEYINSEGIKIREAVTNDMFAAIGLLNLAAIEEGQVRELRYQFPLEKILTRVAQNQREVRLQRAAMLAEQNLLDPAQELMTLESFKNSLKLPLE